MSEHAFPLGDYRLSEFQGQLLKALRAGDELRIGHWADRCLEAAHEAGIANGCSRHDVVRIARDYAATSDAIGVTPPPADLEADDRAERAAAEALASCKAAKPAGKSRNAKQPGDVAPEIEPWPIAGLDIAKAIRTAPQARNWHTRDKLLLGRGHCVVSVGGTGKTRLLIQLAVGTTCGRNLFDWQTEAKGSAVLILSEDDAQDAHGPINATVRALNLAADECEDVIRGLHVYPLAGEDCRLLTVDQSGILIRTALAERLIRRCEAIPNLRFIGLDPAVALSDGDELNQLHQRRLGEFVDALAIRTGACTLLSAHARKSLSSAQEVESHSARGGGALTDALRAEFVLRSMTAAEAQSRCVDDAERNSYVQLLCTKANHVPPSARAPIWLRRTDWGVLVAADLQEPANKVSGAALTRRHTDAMHTLWRLGNGANVSAAAWRNALIADGLINRSRPESEAEAFRRIAASLREHGLINSVGGGKSTAYAPTHTPDAISNAEAAN